MVRCVGDRNGSVGFNLSILIMGRGGRGDPCIEQQELCRRETREKFSYAACDECTNLDCEWRSVYDSWKII